MRGGGWGYTNGTRYSSGLILACAEFWWHIGRGCGGGAGRVVGDGRREGSRACLEEPRPFFFYVRHPHEIFL